MRDQTLIAETSTFASPRSLATASSPAQSKSNRSAPALNNSAGLVGFVGGFWLAGTDWHSVRCKLGFATSRDDAEPSVLVNCSAAKPGAVWFLQKPTPSPPTVNNTLARTRERRATAAEVNTHLQTHSGEHIPLCCGGGRERGWLHLRNYSAHSVRNKLRAVVPKHMRIATAGERRPPVARTSKHEATMNIIIIYFNPATLGNWLRTHARHTMGTRVPACVRIKCGIAACARAGDGGAKTIST